MTIRIGSLTLFARDSGGWMDLASYHPRSSQTWHWAVRVHRRTLNRARLRWWRVPAERRIGQWHDYLDLPFGITLTISRQDWHQRPPTPSTATERAG